MYLYTVGFADGQHILLYILSQSDSLKYLEKSLFLNNLQLSSKIYSKAMESKHGLAIYYQNMSCRIIN